MKRLLRKVYAYVYHKKLDSYLKNLKNKGLHVGDGTSILEPFFLDPDHCFLINIGKNCTLAPNVRLIAHDASTRSHLGFSRIGMIDIGDNCFIGDSTIILPSVTIGENTIVGSGSIVNKDLPENSVAAGNPAKVICTLEEYLKRIEIKAKKKGVFGEEYHIDKISQQHKKDILQALAESEGYII